MYRNLWQQLERGKVTEREAFDRVIVSTKEDRFEEAIAEMPEKTFLRFREAIAPTKISEDGAEWDLTKLSVSQLEMHAFGFDMDKALTWKISRMSKLHDFCTARTENQDA